MDIEEFRKHYMVRTKKGLELLPDIRNYKIRHPMGRVLYMRDLWKRLFDLSFRVQFIPPYQQKLLLPEHTPSCPHYRH